MLGLTPEWMTQRPGILINKLQALKLGMFWAIVIQLCCPLPAMWSFTCICVLPWFAYVHVCPHGCCPIVTPWQTLVRPHGLSVFPLSLSLLSFFWPSFPWDPQTGTRSPSCSILFCPVNWLIKLFIHQSLVMGNNFYITFRPEMLNHANIPIITRCLGIEISIWIYSIQNRPPTDVFTLKSTWEEMP